MTPLDTQPDKVKLHNLIETFADAFQYQLQYATEQKFNMDFMQRQGTIKYNDVTFNVTEGFCADRFTGDYNHRIYIEVPSNIMQSGYITVAWKSGTRTEEVDLRKRACNQLARKFVTEVLPKVDFELKRIVYNDNIDKILSVLDG